MTTAAARRAAVANARSQHAGLSERGACRYLGAPLSSQRYRSRRASQEPRRQRLRELALGRVRWGYRRVHVLLRREGLQVNHKRV